MRTAVSMASANPTLRPSTGTPARHRLSQAQTARASGAFRGTGLRATLQPRLALRRTHHGVGPTPLRVQCIGTASACGGRAVHLKSSALKVDAPPPVVKEYDFLVIGSGIAGLSYALKVAEFGTVAILTKDKASEGSTRYAQGGICAVLDPLDSVESHARDTMVAGDFLCDEAVVNLVCSEGAEAVLELVALGARFDEGSDGALHLTREGGHEHKRIVHAADLTGAEIERSLLEKVRNNPSITMYENQFVTDLVTEQVDGAVSCLGCDAFDRNTSQEARFLAAATMLASGGAGHIYPSTTNPQVATGDGVAMAARAGAAVSNMEFMQFHPTSFYAAAAPVNPRAAASADEASSAAADARESVFLISEAVRGEGGILLNGAGERFMADYDDRLELAPRDVVARAIDHQCKLRGEPCAFLDISHKPAEMILSHFPNIAAHCLAHGIDITRDPIPVTPAMHYTCGGVQAGLHAETAVAGLFACGEAACTGLHGANRLASNSLLEGLVFGRKAAKAAAAYAETASRDAHLQTARAAARDGCRRPQVSRTADPTREAEALAELRACRAALQDAMWAHAGIVRSTCGLRDGLRRVRELGAAACNVKVRGLSAATTAEWYELANLLTVAELVTTSGLMRRESRGLHYTTDFPAKVEAERRPTVVPGALLLARRLDLVHSKRLQRSVQISGAPAVAKAEKPAPPSAAVELATRK